MTVANGVAGARVSGMLVLEDGSGLPGRVGRRRGLRVRRGGVHDRDDRLPGDRHRSELRGAARLLHRADDRQLRRRPGALRVGPHARARDPDAGGARPRVDRLAARARDRRAHRHRHAQPRAAAARRRSDARGRRLRRVSPSTRRSRRRARSAGCAAARSSKASRRRSRTSSATPARRASRSSTTAASARSCAGSRAQARR